MNKICRHPVRVMHVIESLEFGGAERVLVDIITRLPEYFQSRVCCLKRSGVMASNLSEISVPIHELHKTDGNDYGIPFLLAKLLRRHQIDVVHSHNWNTFCESILAAVISSTPRVVHTIHGHHFNYAENSIGRLKAAARRLVERILATRSFRICAVSGAIQDYIVGTLHLPSEKVTVIRNGIDPSRPITSRAEERRKIGLNDSDKVICFVGRLAPVKNLRNMLSAMPGIISEITDVKLCIVGDGPSRPALEKQAGELGIGGRTLFLGYREDARNVMMASDLFVLPSYYEGISMALLEAMAMGLPSVATDVGGNGEIVLDGKTGLLVQSGDVQTLARSVCRLLEDSELRRSMAAQAKSRVAQQFTLEHMVDQYVSEYLRRIPARPVGEVTSRSCQ